VPDELTTVSWFDGDRAQIMARTKESVLDEDYNQHKIISVKQNSARSAKEQPCDLSPCFRILKQLHNKTTESGNETNAFRRKLVAAFDAHKHIIKLKRSKRAALEDFLTCLPTTMMKAMTPGNIKKGFIENGMLDEATKTTPDLFRVLQTCGRNVLSTEYDLFVKTYPTLCSYIEELGYVPESVLDELGYDQDIDMFGRERLLQAGISTENQQRAKILSHKHSRELRMKRAQELDGKVRSKSLQLESKKAAILLDNEKCEEAILKLTTSRQIQGATMSDFGHRSVTKAFLQAFVHVRSTSNAIYPRELPKNKGKLEDAEKGEDNLILRLETPFSSSSSIR
jgi:hypothetical protein